MREVARFPSPGVEPLGLAFDGATLWLTARESHGLYALDAQAWVVREEIRTPGAPFGLTIGRGDLRIIVGFGHDDDDRYLYRFVPGAGFDAEGIACPDLSGVHLAVLDDTLLLSQAHNMRICALDERGAVIREVKLDRRPVGMTAIDGALYLVTGDLQFKNLELTRADIDGPEARLTSLASSPFVARGLAFDGARFWTGDRTTNEIVAFVPSA